MERVKIGTLTLLTMMVVFAAVGHAGPVFQAQGFDPSLVAGQFDVKLNPYATTQNPGCTGPNWLGCTALTGLNGGGSFKASTKTFGGATTLLNPFPTFCLEHSETFSYNTPYTATVDKDAIFGTSGTGADPVSNATGLLYRAFLKGQLDGQTYNGKSFDYKDRASYTQFQLAVWELEQENWGGPGAINFTANALAKGLKDWADSQAQAFGNHDTGVRAMNLWKKTGCTPSPCIPYNPNQSSKAQSQLIWVAVPEPSTVTLLGFSLLAIAATVRRMHKGSAARR